MDDGQSLCEHGMGKQTTEPPTTDDQPSRDPSDGEGRPAVSLASLAIGVTGMAFFLTIAARIWASGFDFVDCFRIGMLGAAYAYLGASCGFLGIRSTVGRHGMGGFALNCFLIGVYVAPILMFIVACLFGTLFDGWEF